MFSFLQIPLTEKEAFPNSFKKASTALIPKQPKKIL